MISRCPHRCVVVVVFSYKYILHNNNDPCAVIRLIIDKTGLVDRYCTTKDDILSSSSSSSQPSSPRNLGYSRPTRATHGLQTRLIISLQTMIIGILFPREGILSRIQIVLIAFAILEHFEKKIITELHKNENYL